MLKQIINRKNISQLLERLMFISEPIFYSWYEWVEYMSFFTDNLIKSYNKNSEIRCTLVGDVEYSFYLQPVYKDIPFLPKKTCK